MINSIWIKTNDSVSILPLWLLNWMALFQNSVSQANTIYLARFLRYNSKERDHSGLLWVSLFNFIWISVIALIFYNYVTQDNVTAYFEQHLTIKEAQSLPIQVEREDVVLKLGKTRIRMNK